MSKIFSGELMQRVGEAALDIFGTDASLSTGSAGTVADGRLEHLLRHSIMIVVGGGTNEIQRTLIAQRGLGLPR
jgi:alkylation response protein AidB-like acyl-CoA dehydrogenase